MIFRQALAERRKKERSLLLKALIESFAILLAIIDS